MVSSLKSLWELDATVLVLDRFCRKPQVVEKTSHRIGFDPTKDTSTKLCCNFQRSQKEFTRNLINHRQESHFMARSSSTLPHFLRKVMLLTINKKIQRNMSNSYIVILYSLADHAIFDLPPFYSSFDPSQGHWRCSGQRRGKYHRCVDRASRHEGTGERLCCGVSKKRQLKMDTINGSYTVIQCYTVCTAGMFVIMQ